MPALGYSHTWKRQWVSSLLGTESSLSLMHTLLLFLQTSSKAFAFNTLQAGDCSSSKQGCLRDLEAPLLTIGSLSNWL